MKFVVVIHPDAEDELIEIMFSLDQQQAGLGQKFMDEYDTLILILEQFAEAFPVKHGFREVSIERFSVLILYIVNENDVLIRKIIHAARDPDKRYKK